MFSWFLLTRSISGVNTTGVPLAELSLYNTYRTEAQRPHGTVRHIAHTEEMLQQRPIEWITERVLCRTNGETNTSAGGLARRLL